MQNPVLASQGSQYPCIRYQKSYERLSSTPKKCSIARHSEMCSSINSSYCSTWRKINKYSRSLHVTETKDHKDTSWRIMSHSLEFNVFHFKNFYAISSMEMACHWLLLLLLFRKDNKSQWQTISIELMTSPDYTFSIFKLLCCSAFKTILSLNLLFLSWCELILISEESKTSQTLFQR